MDIACQASSQAAESLVCYGLSLVFGRNSPRLAGRAHCLQKRLPPTRLNAASLQNGNAGNRPRRLEKRAWVKHVSTKC